AEDRPAPPALGAASAGGTTTAQPRAPAADGDGRADAETPPAGRGRRALRRPRLVRLLDRLRPGAPGPPADHAASGRPPRQVPLRRQTGARPVVGVRSGLPHPGFDDPRSG